MTPNFYFISETSKSLSLHSRSLKKIYRVVAHDEKSKFFIFRPEIWYGGGMVRAGIFFLKNLLNRPKTYKTVVAPRVFKNTQNERDS